MQNSENLTPIPDAFAILECLRQTAEQTLERKRRLGHYAVIWEDGRPVMIGEDAPKTEAGSDPSL